MTETILEQYVSLELLDLKIKEPKEGINFMIGFEGKCSQEQLEAYSFAIEQVLEESFLSPIHHKMGSAQFWEVGKETNKKNLENLMTSIHISAEEYDDEMRSFGASN